MISTEKRRRLNMTHPIASGPIGFRAILNATEPAVGYLKGSMNLHRKCGRSEIDIARPVARRSWSRIAALTSVSSARHARRQDGLPVNLDSWRAGERLLPSRNSVLQQQ